MAAKTSQPHVPDLAGYWILGSTNMRKSELKKQIRGLKSKLRKAERELAKCNDIVRELQPKYKRSCTFQQLSLLN